MINDVCFHHSTRWAKIEKSDNFKLLVEFEVMGTHISPIGI